MRKKEYESALRYGQALTELLSSYIHQFVSDLCVFCYHLVSIEVMLLYLADSFRHPVFMGIAQNIS
jgi:hypothetical protein